jgi:translation elongation factor EF-1alpha
MAEKPLRIAILSTEHITLGELKGDVIVGKIVGGILNQNDKIVINPAGLTCTVSKILCGGFVLQRA